jgi:protein tyrosine/serine phosphatase
MIALRRRFPAAKIARLARRRLAQLKGIKYVWRQRLSAATPAWARVRLWRVACRFDMLVLDHGVFRLAYLNQHRLGKHAWRSGQPAPHHINGFAQRGLRTIVNLRGERFCGSYLLEKMCCERTGIALVDFKLRSRFAPTREELRAAAELFDRIEYPMLIHCKSGADRAGLMSALYLHLKEDVPVARAKRQLSLRYGHSRLSRSGVLDLFFDHYVEDNRRKPMAFLDWVEKVYDPAELTRAFQRGTGRSGLGRIWQG